MTTLSLLLAKTTAPEKPAVSAIAASYSCVNGPPLDYSFKDISKFSELLDEEPRKGYRKPPERVVESPYLDDLLVIPAPDVPLTIDDGSEPEKKPTPKRIVKTVALRVNNNNLTDFKGFKGVIDSLLTDPGALNWIDLSFNSLTIIDKVILEFPELSVLYLHGNQISKLSQIDPLGKLTKLKSLSLHGNPIENAKGYRQYVLSTLKTLRQLDFCAVTKQDREVAKSWRHMHAPKKKMSQL